MPTMEFTALGTTADGRISKSSAVWATARSAATGTPLETAVIGAAFYLAGSYYIQRGLCSFDTLSLPGNAVVDSARLYATVSAWEAGGSAAVSVVSTTNTSLDAAAFALANWGTTSAGDFPQVMAVGAEFGVDLDLGLVSVSKSGVTYLGLRSPLDIADTPPVDQGRVAFNSGHDATSQPRLVVTYHLNDRSHNCIPTMTSNSAPAGVASASSEDSADNAAWKAFDSFEETVWISAAAPTQWLRYQFASAKTIVRYRIWPVQNNPLYTPKTWTFQGSNNGTDWTTLDTQTDFVAWEPYGWEQFDIANTTAYTYYRINVTLSAPNTEVWVARLEMMEDIAAPTDDGEVLRFRKIGTLAHSDVTSATEGGFSDLVRTQVLNEAGSLTFTLSATAPSVLSTWIAEAASVELWVDRVKVATYVVDDFTVDWSACSCEVKCVGIRALGATTGAPAVNVDSNMLGYWALHHIIMDQRSQAGTGLKWMWDPDKISLPGHLAQDAFLVSGALASPWNYEFGAATAAATGGSCRLTFAGAEEVVYSWQGFTARADMCAQMSFNALAPSSVYSHALVCRFVSATSFYMAVFAPTTVTFYKRVGAAYTSLGTSSAYTALATGDAVAFSAVGTALTAYINGVSVYAITDGAITAAGYAGFRSYATGSGNSSFDDFTVTTGNLPVSLYSSDLVGAPVADVLKYLSETFSMTAWFDEDRKLNVEAFRTAIDNTYTVNGTLRDFNTTYTSSGVINQLEITSTGVATWTFDDAASQATYGTRKERVTLDWIKSSAQAQAYATAFFSQYAQPRRSASLRVDHDPTNRPGLKAAVTGLSDGRTYEDLVQQITWRLGDVWDELVTGTPARALTG